MQFIAAFNTTSFRLDIVGFLAILGEGSLEPIAQLASLSSFVFLPRLLPAPQVFLRPSRAEKLETPAKAKVIGIESGNTSENIHHVAHALHRGDKLPTNTVHCVRIRENARDRPTIRTLGPLTFLALIGFSLSAVLFGLSVRYDDGMALLATVFLSALSTVTGIANKWTPTETKPAADPNSPPADVVIRYPHGTFVVVKCNELTARYLYFNPTERCMYAIRSTTAYRALSLVSTLLLMGGVIALANATIELQTGFAAAYMIINIVYWIGAALPLENHWDLSRLEVSTIEIRGANPPKAMTMVDTSPTYTEALWKAIAITGTVHWVRQADWCPKTKAWDEWLYRAEAAAKSEGVKRTWKVTKEGDMYDEVWSIKSWDSRAVLSQVLRSMNADRDTV